jgi:hypothetical protein
LIVLSPAAVIGFSGDLCFAGENLYLKTGVVHTVETSDKGTNDLNLVQKENSYFVVQYFHFIKGQDRNDLLAKGASILRYLPDDALVIESSISVAQAIALSSPSIRAVMAYRPDWKLSPEFSPTTVFNSSNVLEVIVRGFPGTNVNELQHQISKTGAKVRSAGDRTFALSVRRDSLERLARIEGIEWIQPSYEMQLMNFRDPQISNSKRHKQNENNNNGNDDNGHAHPHGGDYSELTGFESGTRLMGFAAPWEAGYTGAGQVVAVADTGLDRGDAIDIHADFLGRSPLGLVFGTGSHSWADSMGHGSHVAGSILGNGKTSGGLIKGAAYEAVLLPESIWSPSLGNLTVPTRLEGLFSKANDRGAQVHSNSWGSVRDFGVYDIYAQQVDEYMSEHPEMLVLFAAGNGGVDANKDGRIDPGSISTPGTAKNVLTVGASKNLVLKGGIQKKLIELGTGKVNWSVEPLASSKLSETSVALAPFSSRGPTEDGRLKPEIVAPGTNILSTRSRHPKSQTLWGEYNSEYLWSGGTSMATPLIAGAAAVVRQYLNQNRGISHPSSALVKGILIHTAKDLYPGQFGEIGKEAGQEILTRRPNMDEGYGLVDMDHATQLAKTTLVDEKDGLDTGEERVYPIHIKTNDGSNAAASLRVTLIYTDMAATVAASKSLVNDLDLVIVDSAGQEKTLGDRVNNTEMLELKDLTGDVEVHIRGINVPQGASGGKQPYALIMSVN